ncbi:MAG TPA: hypothetical protein VI112_06640 [Bacteroidia bacterium]|jgi:hypothetical protein
MKCFFFLFTALLLLSCGSHHISDREIQAIIDSIRMDSMMRSGSNTVEEAPTNEIRDSAVWDGKIRLSITATEQTPGGRILFAETGSANQTAGINITLPSEDAVAKEGWQKELLISSTGKASDNLLQLMAGLSGVKIKGKKFRKELRLTCANLEDVAAANGMKMSSTSISHFKLFHNPSGRPGEYFELYLDINEKEGWLELSEKDDKYRQVVLETFTAK